jgi:hypothetical protein
MSKRRNLPMIDMKKMYSNIYNKFNEARGASLNVGKNGDSFLLINRYMYE